jgi:hypothetical protein
MQSALLLALETSRVAPSKNALVLQYSGQLRGACVVERRCNA